MYDKDKIIEILQIQDWPEIKQEKIVEIAIYRIGTAVTGQLSEAQFNEYKAIIDDDQVVIDAWLEQNSPEYKQSPVYKELEAGYESDPEKNNPAKLFASMAWIQANVPNLDDVIVKTLESFRQEVANLK